MRLVRHAVGSPVGRLTLIGSDAGLAAVLWPDDSPRRVPLPGSVEDTGHPILSETARHLEEYFAGQRTAFSVRLAMRGTAFQTDVWRALQEIPFGQTRRYGELARALGRPGASRAVGAANGRNPISIIVPCHRVVGSTGKLTGFAGGVHVKAHLLELENRTRLF